MGKSRDTAIASFILGISSLIPLLNFITAPLAVYLGTKSIIRIRKEPEKYGGIVFAMIGLLISSAVILFSLLGVGMCITGSKDICMSMGLTSLAR